MFTAEPRLFEPKSLLPGNGILPAETKAPKRLRKTRETSRNVTHASNPATSALLAQSWEISVSEKVRGGPGRSVTYQRNQGLIARVRQLSAFEFEGQKEISVSVAPLYERLHYKHA
jgi:hypothetical protein